MKIKKKYIGGKFYSKTLGRFIPITIENIELFKHENIKYLYVTTPKAKDKQNSNVSESSSDRAS